MRRVTLATGNGMITSGLRDLFTSHGCHVSSVGGDITSTRYCGDADVVVVDTRILGSGIELGLREAFPGVCLILLDDAHMTVYPAAAESRPYRSPVTEERLLTAATAH